MSFLISVEVFDADRAGKDKSLGKVDIPAADLAASAQGRWFPLKGTLRATTHRLNVELDLRSLFGLVCTYSVTHWLRPRNSHHPLAFKLIYARALLASQDRRHLFVNPCFHRSFYLMKRQSEWKRSRVHFMSSLFFPYNSCWFMYGTSIVSNK
jgi:hypothetical protein